jgi:polyisoprenoid-binding protein YceI
MNGPCGGPATDAGRRRLDDEGVTRLPPAAARRWIGLALAVVAGLGPAVGPRTALAQGAAPAAWTAVGEVRYEARDALTSWSGVAPLAALAATFDAADLGSLHLEATVAPAEFRSGNLLRDRAGRRDVFESDLFPTATLTARPAPGTGPASLDQGATATWSLDADLTLHGVTRRYVVEAVVARSEDGIEIRVEATFVVSLGAHGMRRPAVLGLVTDDAVRVSVTATAHRVPGPTPTTR